MRQVTQRALSRFSESYVVILVIALGRSAQ